MIYKQGMERCLKSLMRRKNRWIQYLLSVGILAIVLFLLCTIPHVLKVREDFQKMKSGEYDTVLLSMFAIDNYEEQDFAYYRGMNTLRTEYRVPNGKMMRWYLDKVREYNKVLERVYIGVDPEHTSKEDIVILIQENQDISFELFLSYPQIDYWTSMSETKFQNVMEQYRTFTEWMIPLENAKIYVFGNEEWLIGNPSNYEDDFLVNSEVSEILMCRMDFLHPYMASFDTLQPMFEEYNRLYEKYKDYTSVDAKEFEIVFLGDSVIGNFTDSMSIPQVVEGITKAEAYNFACGGSCATDTSEGFMSLSVVTEAILTSDLSKIPNDTTYYEELKRYLEEGDEKAPKIFIMNYGLNDYFQGLPLESEDLYDTATYGGALRTSVKKIKEVYQDAYIILMTPHFTAEFQFGKEQMGEQGNVLEDYAQMVVKVAQDMDVEVLDNFSELGIHEGNWQEYQPDGTHPNEQGRYLLGCKIVERIKNIKEEERSRK